ncbi:MAG: sugar phosphate isomerase/epimerase [Chloroflexota bacterium]|nr:sugar phosphate isomerase/epimerase [Chloroflexota bacterium]
MKLLVFRALWGMTGASLSEQLERIQTAGYDGVEFWPLSMPTPRDEWLRLLTQYHLQPVVAASIADQADLHAQLHELAAYQPLRINLHSGRDSMSWEEGCRFFEEALRVEAAIGVPVLHETHRGKIMYTPWTTADYLRKFDTLKVTADYSHWVNVCERLPDDEADALALANSRAWHIHGRVGYAEGPQVPDPSAPEYTTELAWHERQWAAIRQQREQAGDAILTFTPEYGPPAYLHTLPHTNVPVADLWNVCLWATERARTQFAQTVID